MPYDELPVTPALITWARARAGVSLEDATKTFKRIQQWEDGESFPTYPQLEQLADAFKVPVAVFFFPAPPTVPDLFCLFCLCSSNVRRETMLAPQGLAVPQQRGSLVGG